MPQHPSDYLKSSSSDESVMLKQAFSAHKPNDQVFYVKPLFHATEEIFLHANPNNLEDHASQLLAEKLENEAQSNILELFPSTIYKISCKMSCRSGGDAHASTINILNELSKFTWDAKVVLSLAAFAVNYGEFWLVYQLYLSNPLAKAVALVKQLPELREQVDALKPHFDSLSGVIKAMLDLTLSIITLKELPTQYISPQAPELSAATDLIPTAAYWIIRACVASASQVTSLIGMANEYIASATESWELSSLTHRINNIDGHLQKQLSLCNQLISEKKQVEAYENFVRLVETPHIDNMRILQALLSTKDYQLPRCDNTTRRKVSLDVLRRKNVLLLITEMEIPRNELSILEKIYKESRHQPTRLESQYEMVWLPIVDMSNPWNEEKTREFDNLRASMPWYSIYHPSLIEPAVIRYIKETWKFNKKPILLVLDPRGRVVNRNALHMMWIWESTAFPFTSIREEALWRGETWRIELIVDGIDPGTLPWIIEGRFVCLYGGEDLRWIRDFTRIAHDVAKAASIPLEMLYVGKSKSKEKIERNQRTINTEKLSHTLKDKTTIWFFWERLESMWYSKLQHGKSPENDQIMQEVTTMLMYDNANPGWAILSGGSDEITKARGDTMLKCLRDFDAWKDRINQKGFVPALREYLLELHSPEHCNHLVLSGLSGEVPGRVVCAECGRSMEKYFMFVCCTD